jgi:site-specific DNA-methyltransferase (adenine-specific)/modification methylase
MIDLRCGDCLKILPILGRIDAVVTDPPYGINYVHSGCGLNGGGSFIRAIRRNRLMPIIGDAEDFDPEPWLGFLCILFGANHYARHLPRTGSWLAWDKAPGKGPADKFADCEFAWCSKPGIKRNCFRYLWKGMACVKAGEENGKRWHPTQKPLGLMRWCIELLKLKPGAMILDPYMGSGSTGVAAIELGFNFIGIEKHRPYFNVARRRINAALAAVA